MGLVFRETHQIEFSPECEVYDLPGKLSKSYL